MQKAAVKDEFGTKIGRLKQIRAYLDFCEEVYGVRAARYLYISEPADVPAQH